MKKYQFCVLLFSIVLLLNSNLAEAKTTPTCDCPIYVADAPCWCDIEESEKIVDLLSIEDDKGGQSITLVMYLKEWMNSKVIIQDRWGQNIKEFTQLKSDILSVPILKYKKGSYYVTVESNDMSQSFVFYIYREILENYELTLK